MATNIFKLIFGGFFGFNVAFFNINMIEITELINCHIGIVNAIIGMVVGLLTIVFMVLQIRKICLDIQEKLRKRNKQ